MDKYEWKKNFAVVNRLYYTERLWETTVFFAGLYTASNLMYIRKNYFAPLMKTRLTPVWMKLVAFNSLITFILLAPLTKEEISLQTKKRFIMGKWLYSTYHLDPENQKCVTDFRLF